MDTIVTQQQPQPSSHRNPAATATQQRPQHSPPLHLLQDALVAVFISNCGALNNRGQVLQELIEVEMVTAWALPVYVCAYVCLHAFVRATVVPVFEQA